MQSILVSPKNKEELKLLLECLVKMNTNFKIVSDKELEDMGLKVSPK